MSVKKHENAGSGCSGACCLKVADLSVSLGEQTILEHVSFHLHCGEITALIGPNGAGKSTLFRTILGQLPHAGTIDFQQAGGRRTRPLIGYVPQSPSFDRGDPVSVLDLFVSAIDAWPVFLPAPKRSAPGWRPAWSGFTPKASSTSASAPCPVASSSGCCWRWPWSRCPTF